MQEWEGLKEGKFACNIKWARGTGSRWLQYFYHFTENIQKQIVVREGASSPKAALRRIWVVKVLIVMFTNRQVYFWFILSILGVNDSDYSGT